MARNYPLDTKLQHFYHEQYSKESRARLEWYDQKKRGIKSGSMVNRQSALAHGLPTINPMAFAIQKKREEDAMMQRIIQEARQQFQEQEMRPAEPRQIKKLFDGFTREGKGRYQYLDERKRIVPEERYTFPILSSWKHGWKLGQEKPPGRSTNARTKLITDTFYTRNGVPTMSVPTDVPKLDRGYTVC